MPDSSKMGGLEKDTIRQNPHCLAEVYINGKSYIGCENFIAFENGYINREGNAPNIMCYIV